ncbi:MAG TPA: SAM-dependent methyltransferase [Chloroflexota bacterium]|nr:SAM-dependent methyltransferase [Chloroflexota bacterium]
MSEPHPGAAAGAAPAVESVMEGQDFYNEHSQPQHSASDFGLPLLARAVAALALPGPGEPVVVADYGASEGRNSQAPMRAVIAAVRERVPGAALAITHTDLPDNDFNSLFRLLAESPDSYLRGAEEVYAFAAGKSFYEQIFPAGQVSLGYSSITVHWLSAVPCPIPGQIWSPRATGAVRAAFAQRARDDWARFLTCRAGELRPGGQLVVVASGADDAGNSGAESLMDLANEVLQEMVADGTLTAAEYAQMVVPTYYRTLAEWTAPFAAGGTIGAALELVESAPAVLPDAFWPRYEQTHDAQAFAAAYTGFLRGFSEPSLFGRLDAARRASAGHTFYQRVQARIAADPARAVCHWQLYLLRIARRAAG